LELDRTRYEAWIGKGESAGGLSTLAKPRLDEAFISFEVAIEYAPEEDRDAVKSRVSESWISLVAGHHTLARNHVIQFPSVYDACQKYYGIVQCDRFGEVALILPSEKPIRDRLWESSLKQRLEVGQTALRLRSKIQHLLYLIDEELIHQEIAIVTKALEELNPRPAAMAPGNPNSLNTLAWQIAAAALGIGVIVIVILIIANLSS
jgi:hypothetical protein